MESWIAAGVVPCFGPEEVASWVRLSFGDFDMDTAMIEIVEVDFHIAVEVPNLWRVSKSVWVGLTVDMENPVRVVNSSVVEELVG